jgi:hypothetical protein
MSEYGFKYNKDKPRLGANYPGHSQSQGDFTPAGICMALLMVIGIGVFGIIAGCDTKGGNFKQADGSNLIINGDLMADYPILLGNSSIKGWKYIYKLRDSGKLVVIDDLYGKGAVISKVWECPDAISYPTNADDKDKRLWRHLFEDWANKDGTPREKLKSLIKQGQAVLR